VLNHRETAISGARAIRFNSVYDLSAMATVAKCGVTVNGSGKADLGCGLGSADYAPLIRPTSLRGPPEVSWWAPFGASCCPTAPAFDLLESVQCLERSGIAYRATPIA
jgi:hypothetical protein